MKNELKDHCVSYEMAVKLKEAGWNQSNSLFYWEIHESWEQDNDFSGARIVNITYQKTEAYAMNVYSAPLATEILEVLPKEIDYKSSTKEISGYDGWRSVTLSMGKTIIDDGYYIIYSDPHPANKVPYYNTFDVKFVDALAKMYIYLKQESLI